MNISSLVQEAQQVCLGAAHPNSVVTSVFPAPQVDQVKG